MRSVWSRIVRSGGIGAVVTALVLAGCGSNDDEVVGPRATTVMESKRVVSMVMPITVYMPTVDEYVTLQRAHGKLVQKCMAERGFDWAPPPPYTEDVFGRQVNRRYRNVLDRDIAAKFGYHEAKTGQPKKTEPSLSDKELAALYGDDELAEEPGGCMGEAIKRLSGGMKYSEAGGLNLASPVREVNLKSYPESLKDSRVRAALDEWSNCMAERGYEMRDPVNYLPEEFDMGSPQPSAAEVEMAVWDVECQERTDVVHVWFDVESQIQRRMIGERTDVFTQIAQENVELFHRATAVVEGVDR
jgi:hypothetical protein